MTNFEIAFLIFTIHSKNFKYQILIIMGRGDKKTKKGKIFQGSFGKSRPHKTKKKAAKKS